MKAVYQSKENIASAGEVLFFLKTLFISYMISFFKYLLVICPDAWLSIPQALLGGYCYIDTYDDIDSSSEEEDYSDTAQRAKEKELLSFMLNINMDKINKYKSSSGDGEYYIRTAIVFRNNRGRVVDITTVLNKISIWCRLFSPRKLYVEDVLMLAGGMYTSVDKYLFMIVEEVVSGYSHKVIVNLSTKKYIPDYSDIMFSKICIKL